MKRLISMLYGFNVVDSSFDPNSFGNSSFEGKGDTRRLQLPEKDYPAFIVGPWGEDGKTRIRVEKGFVILDVVWQPNDPQVQQQLGVEKLPTKRQSIFLDVTPQGGLDMGPFKNGDLNRLREVCGLNQEGVKWSFQDFIGKPGIITLKNKPNKDDPENPYQNISAVTKP